MVGVFFGIYRKLRSQVRPFTGTYRKLRSRARPFTGICRVFPPVDGGLCGIYRLFLPEAGPPARMGGPMTSDLAALFEQGPQAGDLGIFRPFRLFRCRYQGAVRAEEADPVVPLCLDDAVPQADEDPELLAPEPPMLAGLNRLVEPARQAQSLQLACRGLVEEVLRRAEGPGIEVPLLGAILVGRGGGEHLEDDVRQASILFPSDPHLALV